MHLTGQEHAFHLSQDDLDDFYRRLTAFFHHHLPRAGRSQVEDLVQRTLLAFLVATCGSRGRFIEKPIRYLLAIARHKRDDELTQLYEHPESSLEDVPQETLDRITAAQAAQEVADRRLTDELRLALDRLQPVERGLLILSFVEEIGHAEACRRLSIPPAHGSRIKHRALGKLRVRLTPAGPRGVAPRSRG